MATITTPVPDGTILGEVVDGKLLGYNLLVDTTATDALGLVTADPAAFTLLGRLKAIYDRLTSGVAVTGTFWQTTQPVSAAALPLPTGAATETTLSAVNTKLGSPLAVTGTFFQATQPISAASLPLPAGAATETTIAAINTKLGAALPLSTGAATSAAQTTGNASLAAIAASTAASIPSNVYVPITLGSSNLANGACRAIVAEVAGRVNLKQPDGTSRANYPLHAGENSIGALMIDAPTSGTAATGVWALY